MLSIFLNHQWKALSRSASKGGTIAVQIIMGVLIVYILTVSILVGYSMEGLIEKFLPGKDVILVFDGMILYYFAIDFLMRLQMQELPTLAVMPYLHLNISKQKLVNFLNVRALFSAFNLIPLLLFFPFCFLTIKDNYGPSASFMYLVTIFSLVIFNNYAALYFKRISMGNTRVVLIGLPVLLGIGLLEYFHVFSIASFSNSVFYLIAVTPAAGGLFIVLAAAMFLVNARYLKNNLYLEELKSGTQKKSGTDYPFLDRFGAAGTLAAMEIKLILRNKRPRSTVLKSLLFLFYGFLFYNEKRLAGDEFGIILFAALFMSGNITLLYGQFMFSWQSAEFDSVLANKIDIKTFFKAKFLLITIVSTLLTIGISFYGLISWKILLVQFAAYFYNIGLGSVSVLYFATRNYKAIDLSKGSSFNWQGTGSSTMLMSLPFLLCPFLVYLPFYYLANAYIGILAVGIFGITGLLTRKFWLNFLVKEFNKRKYKIAEGFREQL